MNKLDKGISLRSQILGLDIAANNTRQFATDASVVLGGNLVQSLHAAKLCSRDIDLSSRGDSARSNAVEGCAGKRTDDTEPDDDRQVESVRRVPNRG